MTEDFVRQDFQNPLKIFMMFLLFDNIAIIGFGCWNVTHRKRQTTTVYSHSFQSTPSKYEQLTRRTHRRLAL
jgi:hypothetical protein